MTEPSPESFLIRRNRVVDPFRRLSTKIASTILVVEFCQVEGPKPLIICCSDPSAKIDVDSLSIWLMSSETASGSTLTLYNQQMDIHAVVYYHSFYDIRARAFQRPFCVAFLSSYRTCLDKLTKFQEGIKQALSPLLLCNRRMFIRTVRDVLTLCRAIDENRADEFGIDAEIIQQPVVQHRYKTVYDQAIKLLPRLERLLIGIESFDSDCTGHNDSNLQVLTDVFLSKSGQLEPLEILSPCTYSTLRQSLHVVLSHLEKSPIKQGVLFSSGVPIMKLPRIETPFRRNTGSSSPQHQVDSEADNLQLCSMQNLDQLLYPVLAGDNLLVAGPPARRKAVISLVEKLNEIRPVSHVNRRFVGWEDDWKKAGPGVVGVNEETLKNAPTDRAMLNVKSNSNSLKGEKYRGSLLLELRNRRRFPSDDLLMAHIAAQLTRICSLVYMVKHVPLKFFKLEKLSVDDIRIIYGILTELDFVRFQTFRDQISSKRSVAMKSISL